MSDHKNGSSNGVSRKDFLKSTALSSMAIGPMILGGCKSDGAPNKQNGSGKAKNIIFMVSDGMSSGTLNMADLLKRRKHGNSSHWIDLYNSDRKFHRGLMDMASLDSPVTDSAAAGSSWGSGKRINNGAINTSPDGQQYRPIHQIFKDAGKKTGLVTTTRITHATPAAFGVAIEDRNKEDQIAEQYLQREYDLLMGGGARHFMADRREDGKDLLAEFANKNYTVALNKQEFFKASADQRLLGLFYDSHLPYTIDHQAIDRYKDNIPTLAEMTGKALDHLNGSEGFILQVEGGRVDHGAHANDAAAMLYDQIAFDDAIKVALDYVDQRNDTLLVITTDHGNGNPALNGAGNGYLETNKHFNRLQEFRHSNTWILSKLDKNSSKSYIQERVEYATGLTITSDEATQIQQALKDTLDTVYDIMDSSSAALSSVLANYTSINFTSGNHTGDYVELAALGPGIEGLDYFTRNTELFDLMVNAAGVEAKTAKNAPSG